MIGQGLFREAEMFPVLTPAQLDRIRPLGHERSLADGEILFPHHSENLPFFVVLEGGLDMVQPDLGRENLITTHRHGQFVGDIDTLTGRRTHLFSRAAGPTTVLEIERKKLNTLIQLDPELSTILLKAFILRRSAQLADGTGDVVVIGSRHSAATLHIAEFLIRNGRPHAFRDVDKEADIQSLLDSFHVTVDDIPVVVCGDCGVLKRPTIEQVAEAIGLNRIDEHVVRDVVVVGAGPAGLAAAVYAASEGLDVVVVEAEAPGGQAGTSSRIENYLGFPTGISGQDLTGRAFVQAEKFGAEVTVARTAVELSCDGRPYEVRFGGGHAIKTRAVVIATGARYRKPDIANLKKFEGGGVYYAATQLEATFCDGDDIIIVGGANSAGQAAVFMSGCANKVYMMVRGPGLAESMSRYLIRRIEESPRIELMTRTQITDIEGDQHVQRVTCQDGDGRRTVLNVRHIFLMTGAEPNTEWLADCVVRDEKGFVRTDNDLDEAALKQAGWPKARRPFHFETSMPGIFAVGDVRSGSLKRVAAAVGEGSACVQLVHRVLAE